ncbi:MAG: AmmeMemoRadiSam system protein B [Candidatus Krumholzibacteriota bacterium]|nr:AmmeMemoRadiSam system protein B [Candidatus Krumholzibacteriota bacterium]
MQKSVRNPIVAGSFYPADSTILRNMIKGFFEEADTGRFSGKILSLVSPHAGYIYSGSVASHGYKIITGQNYETVVVISPSHTDLFDYSSIFNGTAYRTPLGDIPVDREIVDKITSYDDNIRIDTKGHIKSAKGRGEHSLEVQLPFLQVALNEFKLVPVVMGNQNSKNIESLAEALIDALRGKNFLIVASTDLSHFHNSNEADRLDSTFIGHLEKLDTDGLAKSLDSGVAEACGGGPVLVALMASIGLGADKCSILKHADSGDVSGDTSSVVGYVSAAIFNDNEKEETALSDEKHSNNPAAVTEDHSLSQDDKVFLLKLAREVIRTKLSGHKLDIEIPSSPIIKEMRGAFVTLKKRGRLRGCIGYIEAVKPLVDTISDMAESAAFNDYRFPPVKAGEISELSIEISVLSPITEIDDPSKVKVGQHGLIISRGAKRGLLLPQVPVEWGWDREKFLNQTCIKANLPEEAWKSPDTKIEIFTADVFSEEEFDLH